MPHKKAETIETEIDEKYANVLARFKDVVFGRKKTTATTTNEIIFRRNLNVIRIAAILVLLSDTLWLILDSSAAPENKLYSDAARMIGYTHMGLSAYMIALSFLSKKADSVFVRVSFMIYYLFQIFDVCALAVNFNIRAEDAGALPGFVGVTISTFFLFILDFAPLPSLLDLIVLCAAMLVGCFMPMFFDGGSVYGIAEQITIRFYTVVTYIFIRKINMQNAQKDVQLLAMNEKTLEASYIDRLTHTFNRRALDRYWKYLISDNNIENVAVFIFDIDNFKKYNDFYTHSKGDEAITGVCNAVAEKLGEGRRFLFRYGGEEFVTFLINPTDEAIVSYGTSLCEAVRSAGISRDDGTDYPYITITIGCAVENVRDNISEDYIITADKQLYIGKENKKNCLVYKNEIHR